MRSAIVAHMFVIESGCIQNFFLRGGGGELLNLKKNTVELIVAHA